MHASRKWVQLTTAALWLLAAGCGGGSTTSSSDAGGCTTGAACSGDNDCPTLTCTCEKDKVGDAGGPPQLLTIPGECTGGCCAPCPAGCT